MKRTLIVATTVSMIAVTLIAGVLLVYLNESHKPTNSLYTFPVSVGEKNYTVMVLTNWNATPNISLSSASDINHPVFLDFFGSSSKKTVYYNISIPNNLLWGNISVIWKYNLQSSDRYTFSNNGTHNSVQMKFDFVPFFSGEGHFEIWGTEGAW